ncbi:MAG: histidine--tRNA ligase [bacterium]|nr:histidine--tRNA ligase [bacterium]
MSTDPYKGVRDFYPEDERVQKYIFNAMRRVVERFGYEEMNASILEPTDLYTAKTSEEIVSKQTYTFTDRGERSVTLRPEMTPSVARMVAARKRELGFPLRWYSIQNFFRYERPQRGRLREFWQLNADLFGVLGIEADIETIELAYRVMKELGASEKDFVIRVGSREFLDAAYDAVGIAQEERQETTRFLDAKEKGVPVREDLLEALSKPKAFVYFGKLQKLLGERGIANAVIDANIARGFDYYTGMVFEVFDTDPANPRSLFGGGRWDNLVGQYGKENVPAVGFAMGDVITRDFLETHGLLPKLPSPVHLYLAPVSEKDAKDAAAFAQKLREGGVNVALGMGHEKIGDHIKAALKLGIHYFAAYGEKERKSKTLGIKNLKTQEEKSLQIQEIPAYIAKQ